MDIKRVASQPELPFGEHGEGNSAMTPAASPVAAESDSPNLERAESDGARQSTETGEPAGKPPGEKKKPRKGSQDFY